MKRPIVVQSQGDFCRKIGIHKEYHSDQNKDFDYKIVHSSRYSGMIGLQKCQESQAHHQPNQDSLAMFCKESRVVAVVCDGVSQSFYGNLAAYEVSKRLSMYLWENRECHASACDVTMFLNSFREEVDTLVQCQVLPENLSPVVKEVLEKKREYGSETVLAACVIDMQSESADIYVLGNIRVSWRCKGDACITRVFSDKERWSSKYGCKGITEVRYWNIRPFISLSLQSDGLAEIFPMEIWKPSSFKALCRIEQASHDDDISVVYFERKAAFFEKHIRS